MDITTIHTAIADIQAKLDNADVFRQQTSFCMWGDGYSAVRFDMEYKASDDYSATYETFKRSLTHDEVSELLTEPGLLTAKLDEWFAEAHAWIDAIPTAEERAHRAFTASLGRLIDQGRDIGIEVDFLNPLTAMMEKLATNALEDKRNK
jgi:hypothetical protein